MVFFFSYNFSFLFKFFLRVAYLLADFLAVILTSSIWIVRNWSRVPLRILQTLVTCLRSHGCYAVHGNKDLLKGGTARMAKSSLVVVCIFCCWEIWSRVIRKFFDPIHWSPSLWLYNKYRKYMVYGLFFYFSMVVVFSILIPSDCDF